MRLTKNEKHKHNSVKFVRKFAFFPRRVQFQWIWLESFYVKFNWDFISEKVYSIEWTRREQAYRKKHGFSQSYLGWDFHKEEHTRTSHNWKKFIIALPEDPEVQQFLLDNSPLAKALAED